MGKFRLSSVRSEPTASKWTGKIWTQFHTRVWVPIHHAASLNNAMPSFTHLQTTLLGLPGPLARISHQLLLPTRAHTLCLCYKNSSSLFHFSCVSHPQDEFCLRPCQSSVSFMKLEPYLKLSSTSSWCVLNSFNAVYWTPAGMISPLPASSRVQLFLLFLGSYSPWRSWWKPCLFTTAKCNNQWNFTFSLSGSWVVGSESNWFEFHY